ncbi:MAG: ankyrin repeat domain-containing protein [Pyrinomonadaceae bacterium]
MNSHTTTRMMNAPTVFGAAEDGDAAVVARLLASGASADERVKPGGETPLMRAAARGHETVVRVLLDAGADACARRADGFTPLILAVFFGHEGVVRLLVERGADASARTSLGTTAARWAESRGFAAMADVLRVAEASTLHIVAAADVSGKPESVRARDTTTTKSSDEVEIFSKRRTRADAGRADAGREERAADSQARASDRDALREGVSAEDDHSSNVTTMAGVSVRRGGQIPTHPSASTFRFGHFMRSWQGAVGALLLLAAFGVAVFALMRGGTAPRDAVLPAPAPTAPQAAAQQAPAPPLPTPEPSPAFPTPDPQGIIPVPEQGYPVPNTTGQPYYVTTGPAVPVASGAPNDLTVVTENGSTSSQDAGQSGRRGGANNNSAPARNDNASDAAPRPARTPEPEQQRPAPPAAPPNQTPPPATQPTPGRAKVIQWPPQ